jgi:DNA-binding CsgD family transcriptional regulator
VATIGLSDLSGLLLSLYRSARELPIGDFQRAALVLVEPSLHSNLHGPGTIGEERIDRYHVQAFQEPPGMLPADAEVKHGDRAVPAVLPSAGETVRFNTRQEYPGSGARGIRDCTRLYGRENGLIAADVRAEGTFARWVSLYRADPDSQYTVEERQLCAQLFPHLIEALAINRLVHLEHLEPAGAVRRYHLAIADRHGMLYHSEPGFLDLLGREAAGAGHQRLPETVLAALQSGHVFSGQAIVLRARNDGDLLFLKARPRVLADGLTAREIQVAREVARGCTYKEIAHNLKISPSTARNHIHAIHAKLQVDNKASLTTQLQSIE